MEEKKQDITLYQANPLTESRYEFSPTEKNAFYMVIRQVRKTMSSVSHLAQSSRT